jgi:MFS family permease
MPTDRNRPLYFCGMLSGDLAYQVQSVAVAWHVFTLHHRAFDLGLVGLALFLPTFVLALPAGVFSDRHDRRRIVTAAALLEAVCVAAFIGAVNARVTALLPYLAILAVIGIARAFGVPAERALLPNIVPAEHFQRVQAAYASLRELTVIGGPSLGGVLVAISTPLALEVSVVALLASGLLLGALRIERVVRPAVELSWREAFEGLRFVRSQPVLAGAISLDLFAVLFGGATALLPAFADGIFHAGPQGLGALRSAPAAGATVVAAFLARNPLRRRVGATLMVAVAGFGIATIGFGLSRSFLLSLALLAVVGGTDMVSVVIRNGLVQLNTPDSMRGRVNAVEAVFIGASNELGAFESGTLAAALGVVPSVVLGGAATLAVIALWAAFFPALRDADRIEGKPASVS